MHRKCRTNLEGWNLPLFRALHRKTLYEDISTYQIWLDQILKISVLHGGRNMCDFEVFLRGLKAVTTQSMWEKPADVFSSFTYNYVWSCNFHFCWRRTVWGFLQKWQISRGNIKFPKLITLMACMNQTGSKRCLKYFRASWRDKYAF